MVALRCHCRPFFVSEARAKAIGTLALMVVLLLAVNGLNFLNSYVMRDFMTDLAQRKGTFFYYFGTALVAVFALASIGEALSYFLEQRLGLVWREWLTHRLRESAAADNRRESVGESKGRLLDRFNAVNASPTTY